MGRLTLNILLSFAQFEREVTGERIRDKIAASKAKGMWMGGNAPLGYDPVERELVVNEPEAEVVRSIFKRYLSLQNVFELRDDLERDGVRSKRWKSRNGREIGGVPLTHGALYHILANRIYLGEIVHRGKSHPGRHAPIVDAELFDQVREKLAARNRNTRKQRSVGLTAALLGRLFDDQGSPMTSAHANKNGVRYLYYVSTAHVQRRGSVKLPRLSGPLLEAHLRTLLRPLVLADCDPLDAIAKATLYHGRVEIDLNENVMRSTNGLEEWEDGWRLSAAHPFQRGANGCSLLENDRSRDEPRIDAALLRAVVQARGWADQLAERAVDSIEQLARRENASSVYLGQLMPLAYLAPDLVEVIVTGRQPRSLTLARLIERPLPLDFADQRRLFAAFG